MSEEKKFGLLENSFKGSHLITCDFPYRTNMGAPEPELYMSESEVELSFFLEFRDDTEPVTERYCVATFSDNQWLKLGDPDENNHPFHIEGWEGGKPQILVDSWLLNGESDYHHFVFWFHDSSFQCIARSFQYRIYERLQDQDSDPNMENGSIVFEGSVP